ncbi:hypothetical protein CALCODRAFT_483294 [Calocera cornea HHB12733]|uniref:Uncharacterized protein n=1 Tax=Calocera cornea HHB12733 TaxID=1353952 RepID=A0A165FUC6_9BASI|nr:hypothetical protein CALCODRAFT_483294 [Calocera cornea HHB12733]
MRADMMASYAMFESLRARLAGDFARPEQLAKRVIKALKKVGALGRLPKMEEILEEKKKADSEPEKPDLIETMKMMSLEQLEQFLSGGSSSSGEARKSSALGPVFGNLSYKQKGPVMQKTLRRLQHMLMLDTGAKLVRTDN